MYITYYAAAVPQLRSHSPDSRGVILLTHSPTTAPPTSSFRLPSESAWTRPLLKCVLGHVLEYVLVLSLSKNSRVFFVFSSQEEKWSGTGSRTTANI